MSQTSRRWALLILVIDWSLRRWFPCDKAGLDAMWGMAVDVTKSAAVAAGGGGGGEGGIL